MEPTIIAEDKIERYTIRLEQWGENERGTSITSRLLSDYLSSEKAHILFDWLSERIGILEGTSR